MNQYKSLFELSFFTVTEDDVLFLSNSSNHWSDFFQNEPQIAEELLSLQQKLQSSSPYFLDNNLSPYGGMRMNSFSFQSSFVQMQYFSRNPFQQQLG
jgi:hypothetical protein